MIGYVTIGTNDINRSCAFFDALFAPLGVKRTFLKGSWAGYATEGEKDGMTVFICEPHNKEAASFGNGSMLAFKAPSRAAVDAFHAAALAHGGSDEGAPGVRGEYDPPMYMAYVRDPEGNKFAAFFRG